MILTLHRCSMAIAKVVVVMVAVEAILIVADLVAVVVPLDEEL